MLPRRLRLSRTSFPSRSTGNRASSPSFTAVFGVSKEGGCAAVVGKAVARRAVARHLLKRRIFAIIRPWCRTDRFLVVHARSSAASLSYKELAAELTELMRRIAR